MERRCACACWAKISSLSVTHLDGSVCSRTIVRIAALLCSSVATKRADCVACTTAGSLPRTARAWIHRMSLPSSDFKQKVKAIAYPTSERNGVVWGSGRISGHCIRSGVAGSEWNFVPSPQRYITKPVHDCNWVQAVEGGIDPSHQDAAVQESNRPHRGSIHRTPGQQRQRRNLGTPVAERARGPHSTRKYGSRELSRPSDRFRHWRETKTGQPPPRTGLRANRAHARPLSPSGGGIFRLPKVRRRVSQAS